MMISRELTWLFSIRRRKLFALFALLISFLVYVLLLLRESSSERMAYNDQSLGFHTNDKKQNNLEKLSKYPDSQRRETNNSNVHKNEKNNTIHQRVPGKLWQDSSPPAPRCKLPKLDPNHESVKALVKDLGKLECGRSYSSFENSTLVVDGDDVISVEYRIISRPPQNDFNVIVSNPVQVSNKRKQENVFFPVKPGIKACIIHRASKKCIHPYGGTSKPPPGAKVLLHGDCCFERTLFTMEPTGLIRHVASGYCLHSDPGVLTLGINCTTRFIQVDDKLILADEKNFCLSPKYQASTLQDDEPLAMTSNCTEAFDLMIIRPGFTSKVAINTDFIRVDLKRKQDVVTEVHMNTVLKPEVLKRPVTAGIPVSVCMIMFDSTSAANFQRKMPKSVAHLKTLPTVFLRGNTIVGDGTAAQVAAMLTGIAEEDQPEARRKMANAKPVDDWRFIFKNYKKHGYVTLFTEDSPVLGTFNFRLKGFTNPPTDHYGRYFWIEGDRHIQKGFCVGNERYHLVSFRYYLSLFRTYKKNPKFSYMIQSQISHGNINGIQYADEDLVDFLKTMENENHLNNTIVFIFGDHGARFGELRKTLQGKLEERLPHMSVTFPKWFPEKFPELYKNLEQNAHVLTSPFDVYASLQHLLSYPSLPKGIVTGQSLFTLIDPKNRTCASTGVEEHWCPCLNFEKVPVNDSIVKQIADFAVKHINTLLELNADVKRLCHKLQLKEIKNAQQELPNEKLQLFADSLVDNRCDSCGVRNGDRAVNTLNKDTLHQIQFVTSPNEGFYEATIKLNNGKPSLKGEISRVDTYGKQSICVSETYVHLLKFCYCI